MEATTSLGTRSVPFIRTSKVNVSRISMSTYTLLRQTFGCMQMPVTRGETIIKLYVSKLLLFVVRK